MQSDFDVGRIRSLSDGVFAIAMTLLVLDLKLPSLGPDSDADFTSLLLTQAPRFVSWLLSFALLCRLWIIHHDALAEDGARPRAFLAWNFVFLGCVSFIPFPASLIAEHANQFWSVAAFSTTYAVAGIALAGMRRWRGEASVLSDDQSEVGRGLRVSVVSLLATSALACAMATWDPKAGALIWGLYLFSAAPIRRWFLKSKI